MATENLSQEDQDFLAQVEEELKVRYTESDEEFMKVFNLEPSIPPIMENWYPSSGRRNNFRRFNPYEEPNNRHQGHYGRDSGYNRKRARDQESYSDNKRGYNDYDDDRDSGSYKRRHY